MITSKIHYLNNKLSEYLEIENYEMAAEIRDQINELKEESSL
jgi:protein-arginine kinase activator protein McsA